jgi:Uma2 family endonuclease
MSVIVQPIPATWSGEPAVPDVPIHRLTVDQYLAMIDAGILTDHDRVELLEGWLVEKMTKHPPHASTTRRVRRLLDAIAPKGWLVLSQDPILTGDSAPEPDVAIVRGEEATFQQRHPRADEVALVVEVADASLADDRGVKKRLYARANIRIYWIVNLVDRQIEVYTEPSGPVEQSDYRQSHVYSLADTISIVLDGATVGSVPVKELLP